MVTQLYSGQCTTIDAFTIFSGHCLVSIWLDCSTWLSQPKGSFSCKKTLSFQNPIFIWYTVYLNIYIYSPMGLKDHFHYFVSQEFILKVLNVLNGSIFTFSCPKLSTNAKMVSIFKLFFSSIFQCPTMILMRFRIIV